MLPPILRDLQIISERAEADPEACGAARVPVDDHAVAGRHLDTAADLVTHLQDTLGRTSAGALERAGEGSAHLVLPCGDGGGQRCDHPLDMSSAIAAIENLPVPSGDVPIGDVHLGDVHLSDVGSAST